MPILLVLVGSEAAASLGRGCLSPCEMPVPATAPAEMSSSLGKGAFVSPPGHQRAVAPWKHS